MVARLHCRARPSLCTPSCVHGPAAVVATAMEESRNRFLLKKNKLRPSHKPYQNSLFTKPPNNCTRDYSTRRARPSLCTPCTAQPRPSTHHARTACTAAESTAINRAASARSAAPRTAAELVADDEIGNKMHDASKLGCVLL